MKTIVFALLTSLLSALHPTTSPTRPAPTTYGGQSCVYFCRETGALGYAYGGTNTCQTAYTYCRNYGGRYPQQVFSHYGAGYAAVALGTNANGGRVIGSSAGYASQYDADQRALRECVNRGGTGTYIQAQWYVE